MGRTQVVAVATVPVFPTSHRNVLRQIVVQGSETVVHPGTQVGKITVVEMSARMELCLSPVITVSGPHRTHDSQFVHVSADVWKPVAYLNPAVTVWAEPHLQSVQLVPLIAVRIRNRHSFDGQLFGVLSVSERCFRNRFARVATDHRFGVEALHLADTTIHEQPDHTFCAGSGMRPSVRRSPCSGAAVSVTLQHGGQCQAAKSQSRVIQHPAAGGWSVSCHQWVPRTWERYSRSTAPSQSRCGS